MPVQMNLQQQSTIRLLWSGILAVSILWLLAAGNIEFSSDYVGNNKGSNGIVASVDMPLHANSEHSFTLKRFFSRYKDQPKSAEPPEPIWSLTANDIIALLPRVTARLHNSAAQNPHIYPHQLQTLNISRAPPLV
jgi:hypothetical protein